MDVKRVNPFIEAFSAVMPQLGFSEVKTGSLSVKSKEIGCSGIVIVLGLLGDFKGNVAYIMETEAAKKIASVMMMGMPVEEIDEMAGSALSELSNMLTANAATCLDNIGVRLRFRTADAARGRKHVRTDELGPGALRRASGGPASRWRSTWRLKSKREAEKGACRATFI